MNRISYVARDIEERGRPQFGSWLQVPVWDRFMEMIWGATRQSIKWRGKVDRLGVSSYTLMRWDMDIISARKSRIVKAMEVRTPRSPKIQAPDMDLTKAASLDCYSGFPGFYG